MNYTKTETEHYNQHRDNVCETLGITKNQYNYLRRLAGHLSDNDTDYANGVIEEADFDKKDDAILIRILNYLHKFKPETNIYHQTDPRGASLYISNGEKLTQMNYTNASCIY